MKNPFKYWIWDDNLNREYRIRAYIFNALIWLNFILYCVALPIAGLHNVLW